MRKNGKARRFAVLSAKQNAERQAIIEAGMWIENPQPATEMLSAKEKAELHRLSVHFFEKN